MDIKSEPPCDIFDICDEANIEMFEEANSEMFDNCDEADSEMFDEIKEVVLDETLPEKSLNRYKHTYNALTKWQNSKGINSNGSFDEPLLLNYFYGLSKHQKPSSMWTRYSILKSTIMAKHNIDISKYNRLMAFLKRKSIGFTSNKAKLFTIEEVNKFLLEASDDLYLAMKTVAVFGVIGACKGEETTHLLIDHVKDYGSDIIAKIPDKKTEVIKTFSIDGQYAEIVRKYMKLRPAQSTTNRFFVQYLNGKCTSQVLGKHTIGKMPKKIAKYLGKPDHESYTWYSFRQKSSTATTSNLADNELLNRREQWKSGTVEKCIAEYSGNKVIIRNLNDQEITLPSTSNLIIKSEPNENQSSQMTGDTSNVNITSQHYTNGKRCDLRSNVQDGSRTFNLTENTDNTENRSTIFQFFNCNNITFNIITK